MSFRWRTVEEAGLRSAHMSTRAKKRLIPGSACFSRAALTTRCPPRTADTCALGTEQGRTAERDRSSGPRTDRIAGYLRLSALHWPGRGNATRVVAATRPPPG